MGVLSRSAYIAAVLAICGGCAGPRYRLRLDAPRGQLTIPAGAFVAQRTMPIPFVAEFEPSAVFPVRIDVPANVAATYGATGPVRLEGQLFVYGATAHTAGSLVPLDIGEGRLRALIGGTATEASAFVAEGDHTLARIVLRRTDVN